ncbi:MAG: DUF1501 domain-containing protein [Pseudomonadota bacterium]
MTDTFLSSTPSPTRRGFLKGALGVACSAAASPLLTPVTVAAAPGENRLVIIVLRGAMDGLGVFAPYGDRDFAALRPGIGGTPDDRLIDLDGRFGVDRRLGALIPLWSAGELGIAHAVSTPYRGKRSHFDGQDLLEAGVEDADRTQNGWLNRALGHLNDARAETAIAVGREDMLLMRGPNPSQTWAPGTRLVLENDERRLLQMIYAKDPLFAKAAATAEFLSGRDGKVKGGRDAEAIARYAARRLNEEARIAAFSIGGWDTHASQPHALQRPLKDLSRALIALREQLGGHWGRTMVIAMTEFGRTAAENGNRGTDHGTGGAALLAGGALKGGRVFGDWPGLKTGDLFEDRDLMPTQDVRHYPAWALSALFGIDRTAIEAKVFPGLDMGPRPSFIA